MEAVRSNHGISSGLESRINIPSDHPVHFDWRNPGDRARKQKPAGRISIGIGFYEGALLGGLAIVFTVSGLIRFDIWLRKKSKYLELYIEYNLEKGNFGGFLKYAREHDLEVNNIRVNKGFSWYEGDGRPGILSYSVTVSSRIPRTHSDILEILSQEKGILFIEEM